MVEKDKYGQVEEQRHPFQWASNEEVFGEQPQLHHMTIHEQNQEEPCQNGSSAVSLSLTLAGHRQVFEKLISNFP